MTVIIRNYSFRPPQLIGCAHLGPDGVVQLIGFEPHIEADLRNGVMGKMGPLVKPEAGQRFLDAMLIEFRGSYIRAKLER